MMKKVWLVLLAVVLVSGLAMLGCSHSGSKDKDGDGDGDDVTVTPVVLGEGDEVFTVVNNDKQKGWATNGVDDKEYPLDIKDLIAAKYLVLELSKKPTGGLQVYWQGDGNSNWAWTQTDDVLGSTGVPNPIKGATLSDANVLKIELSKAFKSYGKLKDCTKVKFFIGYFSDTVDDLGVKKAYLEIVSGGAAPTVESVAVDPATVSVVKGKKQQFTATVTGTNDPVGTVTWTITGAEKEGTTISDDGLLTVAADEGTGTKITVKATSEVDATKSGTATVTVVEDPPTVATVAVTPNSITVVKGVTQQFSAVVTGTNGPAQTVTWSIVTEGVASGTTIDATGLLTVAAGEAKTEIIVKATSLVDTEKSGTATVTITDTAPTVTTVTVTPGSVAIAKGATKTFTAAVVGTNNPGQGVTWSVDTTGVSTNTTISATGLFSLGVDETQTTITIKATSVQDSTKSGTATVTINSDFFTLGPFDDDTKTWGTDGVDNDGSDLTEAILASAKYLVVRLHTTKLNGLGGLQFAHHGGLSWAWHDVSVTGDWTPLQPDLGFGSFGDTLDFYVVIDLSTIPDWDQTTGGGGAKIYLNDPAGWTLEEDEDGNNYSFVRGFLTSGNLTKPTASVDAAKGGTKYGWIAVDIF